ncbi:MAG: sugar transferase, partial [Dehalococcoidia bacterium]|nr:sugar transferase [Dehalococcoidia bacterium]
GPILTRRPFLGRSGEHYDQWLFATARLARLGHHTWISVALHRLLIAGGLMYYPSLVNVLRRELSFVGPRPSTSDELARCYPWGENLLTLRPGLTGPWWLGGKDKLTIEQRVQLDLSYLRNYSIWLDLQILYQTVWKLILRFARPDDDQRPPPIPNPEHSAVSDRPSPGVGQAMGA